MVLEKALRHVGLLVKQGGLAICAQLLLLAPNVAAESVPPVTSLNLEITRSVSILDCRQKSKPCSTVAQNLEKVCLLPCCMVFRIKLHMPYLNVCWCANTVAPCADGQAQSNPVKKAIWPGLIYCTESYSLPA